MCKCSMGYDALVATVIRRAARRNHLVARKTNGLWHVYDKNQRLLSPEEGVDDSVACDVLRQNLSATPLPW